MDHNSGADNASHPFVGPLFGFSRIHPLSGSQGGAVVVVTYTLTPEPSSIITSIAKTMRGSIFVLLLITFHNSVEIY